MHARRGGDRSEFSSKNAVCPPVSGGLFPVSTNRKRRYHTEQAVYPLLKFSVFEPVVFGKARSWIKVRRADHPWLRLSDEDLLVKAGLWRTDSTARTKGYTLAAALLYRGRSLCHHHPAPNGGFRRNCAETPGGAVEKTVEKAVEKILM